VPTPEELHRQAEALARVRAARVERDRVTADAAENLRRAIIDADRTGASVRDVAAAAGMSRQWVWQILRDI
jgi:hypothetical protein